MKLELKSTHMEFYDYTHGDYGFMVWFLPLVFMFFCWPLYMSIKLLLVEIPTLNEAYVMLCVFFWGFLAFVIWFGSSIIYALKTVQSINFENDNILLTLYYCKKLHLNSNEIEKIDEFKINRLMSQTRTFPKGGIGLKIYLKNGKNYLISPNIDEFDELKSILISV